MYIYIYIGIYKYIYVYAWIYIYIKSSLSLLPSPTLPSCVYSELFYPLDLKNSRYFGVSDSYQYP